MKHCLAAICALTLAAPVLSAPAEARGMYCTRHPQACRERREHAAEQSAARAKEAAVFDAELRRRLTPEQYERIDRSIRSLSDGWNAEAKRTNDLEQRLYATEGRPTWFTFWTAIFGAFVAAVLFFVAASPDPSRNKPGRGR